MQLDMCRASKRFSGQSSWVALDCPRELCGCSWLHGSHVQVLRGSLGHDIAMVAWHTPALSISGEDVEVFFGMMIESWTECWIRRNDDLIVLFLIESPGLFRSPTDNFWSWCPHLHSARHFRCLRTLQRDHGWIHTLPGPQSLSLRCLRCLKLRSVTLSCPQTG